MQKNKERQKPVGTHDPPEYYWSIRHAHTHTHNHLTAFRPGLPGSAGSRRNIHPLTLWDILYQLPPSIHPLCSIFVLDNPFVQSLSRSSLVFLWALDPALHPACISSPSHHLLFATHAHTNTAACSAVIPMLCHLFLISLSLSFSSLLGNLSFSSVWSIRQFCVKPALYDEFSRFTRDR